MNPAINEFCNAGLHILAIPAIDGKPTKAPMLPGWNVLRGKKNPHGYSANSEDFQHYGSLTNFGIYHAASHTLAFDIDDLGLASKVFDDVAGIALHDWLTDPLRAEIRSPKANRGKLLFKLPNGFTGAVLRQFKHDKETVFELRAGNCQDVIYGQHPEGGNYQFIGNPSSIPEAPAILLDMMANWDDWKPCLDSALGIEQTPPPIATQRPQQGDDLAGRRDPIKEFNQSHELHTILTRNGYTLKSNGRYSRPGGQAPTLAIMRNCSDGILRAYGHAGSDVLNDGYAHDAFDCYRILECNGDLNAALGWNDELTKYNQRLFMQAKDLNQSQQPQPQPSHTNTPTRLINDPAQPFDFNKFSLKGKSETMQTQMLETRYVLGKLAILGQSTVIYAKPNTGKTMLTLHLIIDAIKAGNIEGNDVFYINCDDDYRGLVTKVGIAEQYNFHMLCPGMQGFETRDFIGHLDTMNQQGTSKGKIIILDTLKKFTDLMDKKLSSQFMTAAGNFITHGGTLIMLAHVNKNRSADGKVIAGGTSDVSDDANCVYTLDEVETVGGTKKVLFENTKCRGDVAKTAAYSYSVAEGATYVEKLESVQALDDMTTDKLEVDMKLNDRLFRDKFIIESVIDGIEQGITTKTGLTDFVMGDAGIGQPRARKVLSDYEGSDKEKGHRWRVVVGARNSKTYELI